MNSRTEGETPPDGKKTNNAMASIFKDAIVRNIWFHILTFFAVVLIVASFLVPPTGVVDGSVLAAIGELFGFAGLGTVIKAMDKGIDATITSGNTTIAVGDDVHVNSRRSQVDNELIQESEELYD